LAGPYKFFGSLYRRARPNIAYSRVRGSPLGQGEQTQIDNKGIGQIVRGRAVHSIQFLIFLFSFREEDETKRYPYFMKAANNALQLERSHPMTLRVFLVKRSKSSSSPITLTRSLFKAAASSRFDGPTSSSPISRTRRGPSRLLSPADWRHPFLSGVQARGHLKDVSETSIRTQGIPWTSSEKLRPSRTM